jgi:N utilization substance protein A
MKLDGDDLRAMALFESITGARVIDFMPSDESYHFLIDSSTAARAIGKNAENLKRFREVTGRRVNVYVHYDDERKFAKALFRRFEVESIEISEEEGQRIAVVKVAPKDKARAIGRKGRNVSVLSEMARNHSKLDGVRIV